MHQISDKDLDRLSMEASDQADPDLNTSGWDDLEKRLDKEMPLKTNDRRRYLFFILLVVLLSGGGLVWTVLNTPTDIPGTIAKEGLRSASDEASIQPSLEGSSPSTNRSSLSPNESSPSSASGSSQNRTSGETPELSGSDKQVTTGKDNNTAEDPQETSKTGVPENKTRNEKSPALKEKDDTVTGTEPQGVTTDKTNDQEVVSGNKIKNPVLTGRSGPRYTTKNGRTEKNHLTTDPAINKKNIIVSRKGISDNITQNNKTQKPAQDDNIIADDNKIDVDSKPAKAAPPTDQQSNDAKRQATTVNDQTPDSVSGNDLSKQIASSTPIVDSNLAANQKSQSAKKDRPAKKKSRSFQKMEIGIVGGPDMSTIKYTYADKPGFNAGIQLGYRLSERWSLHSGLIYTKKNYSAKGEDFHPPKDYWTNNVDLTKIEGSCFMLDIPLNVRYVISSGRKRRLFVSTGLSTYLMSKETYQYYYPLNGVDVSKNWTNNKNSDFFFSILNLSGGFEKDISKHFSFQMEPYLKVPLKGVGFGSIKMSSYGIYFSLIYKPF